MQLQPNWPRPHVPIQETSKGCRAAVHVAPRIAQIVDAHWGVGMRMAQVASRSVLQPNWPRHVRMRKKKNAGAGVHSPGNWGEAKEARPKTLRKSSGRLRCRPSRALMRQ